ncbi:MAG: aminoacyl-tRNA hydrolase [Burkholderiales bacterium]|nr:MAG: aminoacyl-tRNA hydrolase [Burkholderiales bacterium]
MSKPHAYRVDPEQVEWVAIRASGPGGQNVNKVSNAVQLRFDVRASSLPEPLRERVLALRDQRISAEGVIVIRAQRFRSLERNRADALERLQCLIDKAAHVAPRRRATRPTAASQRRRVDEKVRRGRIKALRRPIAE